MTRFLVKVNYKNKTIEHVRIPKGMSYSAIAQKRAEHFKGYRLVRAQSSQGAVNNVLKDRKLVLGRRR